MKTRLVLSLIVFAALLAACAAPATTAPVPTAMPNPTAVPEVVQPTNTTPPTEAPAPTTPPQPTDTTAPTMEPAAGGAEVKVAISGFKFDPVEITINVGDTVTWTNNDSATHNVQADDGSWKSPDMAQGESFSYTFTTAGTVPYNCGFHAKMKATVIVK